jgi:hypothetical protein
VAPEGMSTAGGFWTQLRAQGDAEAVLARGYRSAYRSLSLSQIHYTVDVAPYVLPGWFPLGRVVGSGGIDCSQLRQGSCTATFSGGSSVTLTAIPNSGAEFVDWQICDTGNTNPTLTFTLNRDSTCFPRFRSLPASYPLDVGVVSTGNGLIASDDGWISCGYDTNHVPHSSCNFNYSSGSLVVLRAYPSDSLNAYDLAWGGDCAGTAGETSFVMDGPKTCTVELTPRP